MSVTISPDRVIGSYLVAKKNVIKYAPDKKTAIAVFRPGDTVGKVYSYITNPYFMWMFEDGAGNYFYTRHLEGAFEKPISVQKAEIVAQQDIEDLKKEEAGAFNYYFDKIGKPILAVSAFLLAMNIYLKHKK